MRFGTVKGALHRVLTELDHFSEEWIGWQLPPVARVIEESDWEPTPRVEYCHRCGQSTGKGEFMRSGCGSCRNKRIPTDDIVRLGSYSGDLRHWILHIKYQRWTEMARHLGRELGQAVKHSHEVDLRKAVVVPMPMPWIRQMYRGIDHASEIARAVARELDAPLAHVLSKANGPTQLGVPKSARRVNARRGMGIRWRFGGWPLHGLHVILVDDVRTSGSSLDAAARLLRPLGVAKVVAAVLGVAETGRRAQGGTSGTPEVGDSG